MKDYGEEAIAALCTTHDVNWFKGVAEYAHVYVFWNEDKIVGVVIITTYTYRFICTDISDLPA